MSMLWLEHDDNDRQPAQRRRRRFPFLVLLVLSFALSTAAAAAAAAADYEGLLTTALERLRQEFDETASWQSLLPPAKPEDLVTTTSSADVDSTSNQENHNGGSSTEKSVKEEFETDGTAGATAEPLTTQPQGTTPAVIVTPTERSPTTESSSTTPPTTDAAETKSAQHTKNTLTPSTTMTASPAVANGPTQSNPSTTSTTAAAATRGAATTAAYTKLATATDAAADGATALADSSTREIRRRLSETIAAQNNAAAAAGMNSSASSSTSLPFPPSAASSSATTSRPSSSSLFAALHNATATAIQQIALVTPPERTLLVVYKLPEALEASNVVALLKDSLSGMSENPKEGQSEILYDIDAALQHEAPDVAAATALSSPGVKEQVQQLQRTSALRDALSGLQLPAAALEGNSATPPVQTHYLGALHMDVLVAAEGVAVEEMQANLAAHDFVKSAALDEILTFDDGGHGHTLAAEGHLRVLSHSDGNKGEDFPDDTYYSRQWALHGDAAGVKAPEAWEIWSGRDEAQTVTVALLDSGVLLDHRDLMGQLWVNPDETCDNGQDDDGNGYVDDCNGWDFVSARNGGMDLHGHGSASAGIIAAHGNNGRGVAPLCWNCRVMNLRVLNEHKQGRVSAFVAALDYAVNKGARISNNSYGGVGGAFEALRNAIERAGSMLFVAAAGNEGNDNDDSAKMVVPASWALDNIVAVAAVEETGELASFSNYGKRSVHLAAPGASVLAPTLDNAYQFQSGTSFASPQVAGVAGLILGRFPSLDVSQVKQALVESARPLENLKGKTISGGLLDAAMALEAAAILAAEASPAGEGTTAESPRSCETLCPPETACIKTPDGVTVLECRCPEGTQWDGSEKSCVESQKFPSDDSEACATGASGPCSHNAFCRTATSLLGRSVAYCECYPGYAYAEDSRAACVPLAAVPLTLEEYEIILSL